MLKLNKIERLKGHQQAQAQIIRDGNEIILRSYYTNVLYYNVIDKTVYCTGLYSMTTIKHIGWFASQFLNGINYYDIKHSYNNNYSLIVSRWL